MALMPCGALQGSEPSAGGQGQWWIALIDDPDGYVNLRTEANTQSKVLTRIKENEVFLVARRSEGEWYEAKTLGGAKGYVHQAHFRTVQSMAELGKWALVNSLPMARSPDWLLTQDHLETLLSPERSAILAADGFISGWQWFRNADSGQTMVLDLYTDNFPITTILFSDAHADEFIGEQDDPLIMSMSNATSPEDIRAHWRDFAGQARTLDPKYFVTEQGVKLGASVDEVVAIYGKPHRHAKEGKLQTLWWDYKGRQDFWYEDGREDMLLWRAGTGAGVDVEKLLEIGKVGVVPHWEFRARAIFSDGKLVWLEFKRGVP